MKDDKREQVFRNLNYLLRTYDGLNKLLTSTKNRIQATNPDMNSDDCDEVKVMASLKGKLSRRIEKELGYFPIWTEWMVKILGLGPFIAGNLIIMWYCRFIPVCKDCGGNLVKVLNEAESEKKGKTINSFKCDKCGKKASGDGVLNHRLEYRDFPNVAKWWHFMGVHCDEQGVKPRLKAGTTCTWSSKGRNIAWNISEQFNRGNPPEYKALIDEAKRKHERKHPDAPKSKKDHVPGVVYWSKGHRHNAAKNEASKIFLSHFWHVARRLDGKSVEGPYAQVILGHTGIIPPYYWDDTPYQAEAKKAGNH